jgi:LPXTG-motif cell wall-anchored protein
VAAPNRIAALAVSIALAAAPAAARAQNGAGDEQYQDPFAGGSQQPAAKPKPKQQATPVKPVPHQQVQSSAQQAAPSAQQSSSDSRGELPRTGFDVVPLALLGVALVAAGLVLRRRANHGRD